MLGPAEQARLIQPFGLIVCTLEPYFGRIISETPGF
jgi:hypothetical protein